MNSVLNSQVTKRTTILRVLPSSLLINLLSLVIPLVILQIYDRILPNQSYGTAFLLLGGSAIAICLDAFLRYVRSWMLGAAAVNTEHSTYRMIVKQLNIASTAQIKRLKPGTLQESLKGIGLIKDFYSGGFISGLIDVPFAVIFLGLIYYVGGDLVFIPIVVWAITFAFVWLFTQKSSIHSKVASYSEQSRMNFLILIFAFFDGVKTHALESKTFRYFRQLNEKRYLSIAESERKVAIAQELIQIAAMGTSVAVVLIGSLSVLAGDLTSGGLAACSILSGRAVAPLSALMGLRLRYSSFLVANESVTDLLQQLDHPEQGPLDFDELETLNFENVTFTRFDMQFSYSLSLQKGQAIALCHDDNDVSSTAAAVFAGLESVDCGDLTWNGTHFFNDQFSWRHKVSFVPIHPHIVSGSLLDNICGFDGERLDEANLLVNALGLNRVISDLSDGLETKVGFNIGTKLSRGGTKLVSLVAQLSRDTPIVVLDEPESDLDIDSLKRLSQVIKYYQSLGRTFIINTESDILLELTSQQIQIQDVQKLPTGDTL
ncbi:ABC transporter permease [Vibrio sp. UCD-FRSSP16_10]|uniref:ABC transporter transmembrane domain-containing protein n=1 Tax=unclassified Vibrio TaxID=2614977 RepID=UPI0007FF55AA|nr:MULTISPECIES: ABC transporter transmembrane domain-containing protein [unclassified Vibrio]OBT15522.1 ABC transporter permease [Vibrio sp. UCD-FRSSP16_30]OBT20595.1 ABC transporter permease [Vibrio sp. UCD-FRSSP16_10]